ncbi:hypothetical protein XFF6166_590119 [Xanthomonas citri pv. fuscans]|nr:hypothetical protein XFF6166_590119 [Xanthomonas citri pv. fuscans]SON96930.1 hypothetical protein XFF6990_390241 [Xanthomonas citri pv. fuscans]SOO00826.1 hypothetical protein XFF6960_370118 [Xanthomonas citri pv. fuscans]SOO06482.1 hypothetical protein XFF7767_700119 [Xanthomonas citri pv. fuscans]SOO10956.1 hypothetical protein XFF6970_690018 [Xanthomonas citri pv. fuscans]
MEPLNQRLRRSQPQQPASNVSRLGRRHLSAEDAARLYRRASRCSDLQSRFRDRRSTRHGHVRPAPDRYESRIPIPDSPHLRPAFRQP